MFMLPPFDLEAHPQPLLMGVPSHPMSDLDGLFPAEIAVLRTMADPTQTANLIAALAQLALT